MILSKFGGFLVSTFSVPFRPLKEKGILDLVQTDPYKNWLFSSLLQKIIKSKMVGKQNRRKKIEWQKLNTQIYWNYVQYQSKFNEKKQKKKNLPWMTWRTFINEDNQSPPKAANRGGVRTTPPQCKPGIRTGGAKQTAHEVNPTLNQNNFDIWMKRRGDERELGAFGGAPSDLYEQKRQNTWRQKTRKPKFY